MPLHKTVVSILLALVILTTASVANVSAQDAPEAPSGVTAVEGSTVGEVIVSWNPVPDAQFYSIGWIARSDYHRAVEESGDDWQEAIVSVDVRNRGQSSHTITRLSSGEEYTFRVGSASERFGTAQWSEWSKPLTLVEGLPVCPPGTQPSPMSGADSDRDALIALYHATSGPDWTINDNWLSGAPIGEWYGVATDPDGRVTWLDLVENGLTGEIPPELGNLSDLEDLGLYFNNPSGEMPAQLGNLANLQKLNFNSNLLTGGIPPELGGLAELSELHLWGNRLSGEIPPELGSLSNLQNLGLADNRLSGTIPPELGSLADLQELYLRGNFLYGQIPP